MNLLIKKGLIFFLDDAYMYIEIYPFFIITYYLSYTVYLYNIDAI